MDYDTYTADAVQLAVDLANLVAPVFDEPHHPGPGVDADPAKLARACTEFMADHDDWFAPSELGPKDHRRMARLAHGLRAVALAESDDEAADRLNTLLGQCAPAPRATNHDGVLHLHYSDDGAPLVDQLGATASMAFANLVCRDGRERLGICSASDCADVYVDTSRNRSRRYCSETCASRTTVSAYRARRKSVKT